MLEIKDKTQCCACSACVNICPLLNNKAHGVTIATYAVKHKDEGVKRASSSGGMFTLLASYVLDAGGVVFGATFNENFEVHHRFPETREGLDALRRSKYVQSNIGQTFIQAKNFLEAGRKVLFAGTPCQIAGLNAFLGKGYSNLYTAGIICHSVPSPKVWRLFLRQNFKQGEVIKIDFRDKTYGWDNSRLRFFLKNNKILPRFAKYRSSPYTAGFHSGLYLRPSCTACAFKPPFKNSDFTLGDLWGVKEILPQSYDRGGLSVLFVNSAKGRGFINNDVEITCAKKVTIGDNCAIARGVLIRDYDAHNIISHPHEISEEVIIASNVWIGTRAMILKGVHIGEGAIIAAGAVVTKDIPPKTLAGGCPAKVIRENVSWQ